MIAHRTLPLALALLPASAAWRVALVVGGSLVIALAAQVRIALPFSPVPVTAQTFAIFLVGAALGSRLGLAAVVAYLGEGAAGLPVFAGGASGLAYALGPTGGYLAGFAVAAFAVGWLCERGFDRHVVLCLVAMCVGEVLIYLVALPWLARFVPAERVIAAGLLPFIPGDIVKLALAAITPPAVRRALARSHEN